MANYRGVFLGAWLAACGGDHRAVDPPPDPVDDTGEVACRELAPVLSEMEAAVAEARTIPRDPALYLLAARLSRAERTVGELDAELALVEAELGSPDFVLEPDDYRARRLAEPARLEALRLDALDEQEALRDEAAQSSYPALVDPDGPARVLSSLRWRDAEATVVRYREGCLIDAGAVDAEALRDFAEGMAMLEHDGHGVGTRTLEDRLLAGQDLSGGTP